MSILKKPIETQEFADGNFRSFLINNGFEEHSQFRYVNYETDCVVVISKNGLEVSDKYGGIFLNAHDLYWLIGVLTYFGFIDRNYKTYGETKGFA